uniref:Mitochondrial uncoupling protein n=1 Tax=Strombidinopsis acuminata TaxID=141414 RepID=A0A7S3VUD0_9SPIT|mmetsp:Transcript_100747/g.138994  ORF Transcript_100747/g.138994 Transcript_100747/m.138994 type:complete len:303 (+) Transcript_100747:18-926(+)
MSATPKKDSPSVYLAKNMLFSAVAASVAECCTIPIDASKVRLQTQQTPKGSVPKYTNMLQTIFKIASEEGVGKLYAGLTPGVHRQFVNCSIRFGCYESVRDAIQGPSAPGSSVPFFTKVAASATTGIIAICFANPFDVAKVRTQSLTQMAAEKPELMPKGAMDVYRSIYINEGIAGFYRGVQPNMIRNVMVNVGEMATYDQIKEMFLKFTSIPDSILLHFLCGTTAGFFATLIASPADVVKSRLMASPDEFKGIGDCAMRTLQNEGPLAFYKGFVPNFTRLGSWSCVLFIVREQLSNKYINK